MVSRRPWGRRRTGGCGESSQELRAKSTTRIPLLAASHFQRVPFSRAGSRQATQARKTDASFEFPPMLAFGGRVEAPCAGVRGTTTPGTAARPTATGTRPMNATRTSACASVSACTVHRPGRPPGRPASMDAGRAVATVLTRFPRWWPGRRPNAPRAGRTCSPRRSGRSLP